MAKTKLMRTVVDCETGEVSEREFTEAEYNQHKIDQAAKENREAEILAQAEAKEAAQAKLAALGLTVEDLQALGL
jgi:hypothetical protein